MIVAHRMDLPDRRLIALTFDDGPSKWTPKLLRLLSRHDSRATFFVLGEAIAGREKILRRMVAEGHELGNHTFSHPRASEVEDDEVLRDEIVRTSGVIEAAASYRPTLMRAPHGDSEERVARIAADCGLPTTVHWSVNPRDYNSKVVDIVEVVLAGAVPGAIVDLHDGRALSDRRSPRSRRPTVVAVGKILPELRRAGFEFVTVSELLQA